MSPKKRSTKKSKSTENVQPNNVTLPADSNSYFIFSHLDEYSKIIQAAIDAGFSNQEVTVAFDKFRKEGRITDDVELTTNKLICYLKVGQISVLYVRMKRKQNSLKLQK